jgi:hypothetical protein
MTDLGLLERVGQRAKKKVLRFAGAQKKSLSRERLFDVHLLVEIRR